MNAEAFFDTNVLVYAFAQNDPRAEAAEALLAAGGRVSVQVLNEFVAVATRKLGMQWKDVLEALSAIRVLCAAPLESACATLYSEDLHDGQTIDRLAIRNPFKQFA